MSFISPRFSIILYSWSAISTIFLLEKEIENLKTLEIKGLINEVDIPYEELVKMIKELKN